MPSTRVNLTLDMGYQSTAVVPSRRVSGSLSGRGTMGRVGGWVLSWVSTVGDEQTTILEPTTPTHLPESCTASAMPCARINAGGNTRVCSPWPHTHISAPVRHCNLGTERAQSLGDMFRPFLPAAQRPLFHFPPSAWSAWLCCAKSLVLALGLSRPLWRRQKLTHYCNSAFQTDLVLDDPTLPVTFSV